MDNLLCEESWLSSPLSPEPLPNFPHSTHDNDVAAMYPAIDEATMEEAISMDLEKELCFSNHGDKFIEFFVSKKLTEFRFQAVQWLAIVRAIVPSLIQEWTNWMLELVAVTFTIDRIKVHIQNMNDIIKKHRKNFISKRRHQKNSRILKSALTTATSHHKP